MDLCNARDIALENKSFCNGLFRPHVNVASVRKKSGVRTFNECITMTDLG